LSIFDFYSILNLNHNIYSRGLIMEITTRTQDGITIIDISGKLDASNSKVAEKTILDAEGEGSKIILNMENLEYISSAGLRVLLLSAKKARSGHGKFCIVSLSESVQDVFEISGFSAIFEIADNVEEGIKMVLLDS
jgi:anti-anti-sigma factor